MLLRPLNDTVFVEPDPIQRHDGKIVLCDNNSVEKISHWAVVISCGSKCHYQFKVGQRVLFNRFFDTPLYVECNGKKVRIIKEHYIYAVDEDA